ncbi:hypothetical protein BGZ95_002549 [Linnemannia exigua]|uniref:Uncharacterized protein n=1 Tax=Linnemannia exigua TaxID=604196 RepID=A0AAD4D5D8_9FUNG|nr:hypothetical protein BGZ95_002549 [Linnemannia exigua]
MPTLRSGNVIIGPYSPLRLRKNTGSTKPNSSPSQPSSLPSPFVQPQQNKDDSIGTSFSHTHESSPPGQDSFFASPDELLLSSASQPSLPFSSLSSSSPPLNYPYSPSFSPSSSFSLSPYSSTPFSQQPSNPEDDPLAILQAFLTRVQLGTEPIFSRGFGSPGRVRNYKDCIRIPNQYLLVPPPPRSETDKEENYKKHVLKEVYDGNNPALFETNVILTVEKQDAEEYNTIALNSLPGTLETFGIDRKPCADWKLKAFKLQSPHTGSGRPPLVLKLKIGMPIILLQDVYDGECDLPAGTRLIVRAFRQNFILARVAFPTASSNVLVARNTNQIIIRRQPYRERTGLRQSASNVWYTRLQFPIKRAFALAMDDVPEGVTFEGVGLDLKI